MTYKESDSDYESIFQYGFFLLTDLLFQTHNLMVSLKDEVHSFEVSKSRKTRKSKASGSPISVRALKTSIILLQFNVLEAVANFLSEVALRTNEGIQGAPDLKHHLSQLEVDFLSETRTQLDTTTGNPKTSSSAFAPTLDKFAVAPLLLGKLHGIDFRLDKSGNGWKKIKSLKDVRDKLTHFRIVPDLLSLEEIHGLLTPDKVRPAVLIENSDLFSGVEAIRWYLRETVKLISQMQSSSQEDILSLFSFLDLFCWMALSNSYEICGISENSFKSRYPPPEKFKTQL